MSIKLAMELIFAGIEKGGGTFDRHGNEITKESFRVNHAFAVGGKRPTLEIHLPKERGIIAATEAVTKWLDEKPFGTHWGSWVEDGVLYIDAVDIIYFPINALYVARRRGEKAIYDLVTGETIYVQETEGDEAAH
jgi:hypothetical protein